MRRLIAAIAATVTASTLCVAPALAGVDPTGDSDYGTTTPVAVNGASKSGGSFAVYGDQSISTYHITPWPGVLGDPQDQRVQVRMSAKKQTDGQGWVVTKIDLDTWESGTNPATAECNANLTDPEVRSVHGTVTLRKWVSNDGWRTLRTWSNVSLCGGDHGTETLLGGGSTVSTEGTAIQAHFDYDIAVAYGNDVQNKQTWTKRKSTGFSSWIYWCGDDNVITCDEDG